MKQAFRSGLKKVRKGAKMTMGQWCDKEGFKHYTIDTAKEMTKYIKGKKV